MRKPKKKLKLKTKRAAMKRFKVTGDRQDPAPPGDEAAHPHEEGPGPQARARPGCPGVRRGQGAGQEDAAGVAGKGGRDAPPGASRGAELQKRREQGQRSSCPGRRRRLQARRAGPLVARARRRDVRHAESQSGAAAAARSARSFSRWRRATSSGRASSTSSPRKPPIERGPSPTSAARGRSATSAGSWIVRINAAARLHDMSYSQFMAGLRLCRSRARQEVAGRDRGHGPGRVRQARRVGQVRAQERLKLAASGGRPAPGARS